MTWSRGKNRMSEILLLGYWQRKSHNSFVFHSRKWTNFNPGLILNVAFFKFLTQYALSWLNHMFLQYPCWMLENKMTPCPYILTELVEKEIQPVTSAFRFISLLFFHCFTTFLDGTILTLENSSISISNINKNSVKPLK